MKQPVNAPAREVVRLRSINNDIDEQMRVLRERQMENSELIGGYNQTAEWVDDEPIVEPEPEIPPVEEEENGGL